VSYGIWSQSGVRKSDSGPNVDICIVPRNGGIEAGLEERKTGEESFVKRTIRSGGLWAC
jgi:hypothetical protein